MRRRKPTVSEAYDEYLVHVRSMGLREQTTIRNIRSTLKPLVTKHGHLKIHHITPAHISDYFLEAGRRRKASSLSTSHSILNGFFTYCVDAGFIEPLAHPMKGRRRPRVSKRERLRIPVHRWPELMALAEEQSPRDRAIVAVGLYTMLRDQEMMSIRLRDVDLGSGYIKVTISKSHTEDMVPISADLDAELRRWMLAYQRAVGPLKPEYLLLPPTIKRQVRLPNGNMGPGITVGYDPTGRVVKAASVITPLIQKMGYPTVDAEGRSLREGAHTLRRSGARAHYDKWIQEGRADALRIVQNMLHHQKLEQTQEYIGIEIDRITRDELVRGVSIFGLDDIPQIGGGGERPWHHVG